MSDDDFPTAAQSRAISDAFMSDTDKAALAVIRAAIEEARRNGRSRISPNVRVNMAVETFLKSKGYTVNRGDQRDPACWIDWCADPGVPGRCSVRSRSCGS